MFWELHLTFGVTESLRPNREEITFSDNPHQARCPGTAAYVGSKTPWIAIYLVSNPPSRGRVLSAPGLDPDYNGPSFKPKRGQHRFPFTKPCPVQIRHLMNQGNGPGSPRQQSVEGASLVKATAHDGSTHSWTTHQ